IPKPHLLIRHDTQTEIRRVPPLLPQERRKNRKAPQPGNLLYTCESRSPRESSAILQACGVIFLSRDNCGRERDNKKSSRTETFFSRLSHLACTLIHSHPWHRLVRTSPRAGRRSYKASISFPP